MANTDPNNIPTLETLKGLMDEATNIAYLDALTVAYHILNRDAHAATLYLEVLNSNFACIKANL